MGTACQQGEKWQKKKGQKSEKWAGTFKHTQRKQSLNSQTLTTESLTFRTVHHLQDMSMSTTFFLAQNCYAFNHRGCVYIERSR